jgi:hypothetical protein
MHIPKNNVTALFTVEFSKNSEKSMNCLTEPPSLRPIGLMRRVENGVANDRGEMLADCGNSQALFWEEI